MTNKEALDVVLSMARELRATCKAQREDVEMEAIEEVEAILNAIHHNEIEKLQAEVERWKEIAQR